MKCGRTMWPPPFKIDLVNEEIFVIGDEPDNDELIQNFSPKDDEKRFNRLHEHVLKYDRHENNVHFRDNQFRYEETNFDAIEPQPWQLGYADSNVNYDTQVS